MAGRYEFYDEINAVTHNLDNLPNVIEVISPRSKSSSVGLIDDLKEIRSS